MKHRINNGSSLFRVVLTGLVVGPAIMLIMSCILAYIALKTGNSTNGIFAFAMIAVFFGGLVACFWASKKHSDNSLQAGLLTGLANLAVVVIIALITSSYSGGIWNALVPPMVLIIAGIIGTFFATRLKPNPKKRLKKLRRQVK